MDYDSYFGLSTSSRNYQSTLKSQFDICIDFEDIEDDDEELRGDFFCPLCSEDFDLVGLCCHIEEDHPIEAKSGICPFCAVKVGIDLFGHIASQHGNISNSQHRLKLHKGDPHSTILSLRKELHNGHFQSLLSRSSSSVSSSKMAPDPLLSFIYNMAPDVSESVQPDLTIREKAEEKSSYEKASETNVHLSSLPDKDHPEKAKRCEFVQGLIMSTIFDDDGL
ncbi:hypothetical protein Dsin_025502 [Dipteronia sinensis]|uniref:Uncharacterized protein n=1 Tax=Dipteronia sinensis TaxID=43782 RepID=A0AAE0DX11_9ROSI|nr:hypothetical protein Dsin_025502 [Dipteronia sinensis]